MDKKTVLITGCSEGGLGDALARAFHSHPSKAYRVIATARNANKMSHLKELGMETLTLDVLDSKSIQSTVQKVEKLTGGTLDILVNNAGGGYIAPIVDANIQKTREMFDLNVLSVMEVTQAFFPLIFRRAQSTKASRRSKASVGGEQPMIVINTSIAAAAATPLQGAYCATKAAAAMVAESLRLEIEGFGIKVVDLRTGQVKSKFYANQANTQRTALINNTSTSTSTTTTLLPPDSIYLPGLSVLQGGLTGTSTATDAIDSDIWASQVVSDLSRPSGKVPNEIWRGGKALLCWVSWFVSREMTNRITREITGLNAFWRIWEEEQEKENKGKVVGYTCS